MGGHYQQLRLQKLPLILAEGDDLVVGNGSEQNAVGHGIEMRNTAAGMESG